VARRRIRLSRSTSFTRLQRSIATEVVVCLGRVSGGREFHEPVPSIRVGRSDTVDEESFTEVLISCVPLRAGSPAGSYQPRHPVRLKKKEARCRLTPVSRLARSALSFTPLFTSGVHVQVLEHGRICRQNRSRSHLELTATATATGAPRFLFVCVFVLEFEAKPRVCACCRSLALLRSVDFGGVPAPSAPALCGRAPSPRLAHPFRRFSPPLACLVCLAPSRARVST
jgi:hypothetical protein